MPGGLCCLDCWGLPSVDQSILKHFLTFPDRLPLDVWCSGPEAEALGMEVGTAELRQRRECLVLCHLSFC